MWTNKVWHGSIEFQGTASGDRLCQYLFAYQLSATDLDRSFEDHNMWIELE